MKIQKLLLLGVLGLGMMTAANTPVMAKTPGVGAAHKGAGMGKQLGLSKDQKTQLKPIRKAAKEQIKAVKADTTLSKSERKSRLKTIRADRKAKMNAVLTPDQQAKLAQIHADKRAQNRQAKSKV